MSEFDASLKTDSIIPLLQTILEDHYSDVEFVGVNEIENTYYFDGYLDAFIQICVVVTTEKIRVYDRYIDEKQYIHFNDFPLPDGFLPESSLTLTGSC